MCVMALASKCLQPVPLGAANSSYQCCHPKQEVDTGRVCGVPRAASTSEAAHGQQRGGGSAGGGGGGSGGAMRRQGASRRRVKECNVSLRCGECEV